MTRATATSSARLCRMCGRPASAWKNGHAFPTWTVKLLPKPDERFGLESGGQSEDTRGRSGLAGPDVKVRICAKCEDGFPENEWQRTFSGLISRPFPTDHLGTRDQTSLAAFALKVAFLEDLTHRVRRLPDKERHEFARLLKPSRRTTVWAGIYVGDLPYYSLHCARAHLIDPATRDEADIAIATMKVGYLIVQAFIFLGPATVPLVRRGSLTQIWPTSSSLRWPPTLSGYDEAAFGSLCRGSFGPATVS